MKADNIIAAVVVALCTATSCFAQTWTQTTAPNIGWEAVASSADGDKLFAVQWPSATPVYATSTNAGATWMTNAEPDSSSLCYGGNWNYIASSADGNTLVALTGGSATWTSTNGGASWVSNLVNGLNWQCLALSADGTKAVAGILTNSRIGLIFTSTNSGVTWTPTTAPNYHWSSVASSADGTVLAAAAQLSSMPGVPIYVSTNSGATWAPTASPPNMNCTAIASSADGCKLIIGGFDAESTGYGMLYTSTNSGNTWISNSLPLPERFYGVASSADGAKMVAVDANYGRIFTSTNSGNTWNSNTVPGQPSWYGVTSSADGTKLTAWSFSSGFTGTIWTSQTTPSPTLNLTPTNGCLALSWTIPSTNFVLQQNLDLTTTNWSDVTNPPVLNFTNLQNQVTLPATPGNAFYRLATP